MKRPAKEAVDPKQQQYADLLEISKTNPHAWMGCGELAILFRLPVPYITAASTAKDTPFIGKNCHPDLLGAWLRNHPGFTAE